MTKHGVIVVGRGKLAVELLQGLEGAAISRVVPWDERATVRGERCMVVHAGSGRELEDALSFCASTGSILFELSTGDSRLPAIPEVPVVLCPNVNLQMLRFMGMVKRSSRLYAGQDIRILESHQSTKTTTPGTAVYLARALGVPEGAIVSERDPKRQRELLGIPDQFLDRHAFHRIVLQDGEVEVRLESRVFGKTAYATGLSKIIEIAAARAWEPGYHDVVDLVAEAG